MYETVLYEKGDGVATVSLNRPDKLNAFDGKLHEELHAALAQRLAAMPTRALGWIKRSLYASFEGDLASALEAEAEGQEFCGYTGDHAEGLAAFFEKRAPDFTGR